MSSRPTLSLAPGPAAPDGSLPSAGALPSPKYWAFVSYSHRDEAVAKALQKRLETYRLPRRLVGRDTPLGPVPKQARPVFRDRDDLHAGADLGANVRAALAASRWLIVVCSPEAARSPWVGREIVEFKKLHGEGRVLALIAGGEPFASRLSGREAEECFPAALRHALDAEGEPCGAALEPIAADLRAHADGPRRAPLKLLAGMVGVGFDELVRRDHARRVRWLGAIAAGSALGMAVLAVLTVLAMQARNDARQQREQAEGLIEFMLTDLRKKLEPVGRLDVLDAVGEKALAHYEAQRSDTLDATALSHRSRAQHLIGEMRQQRGQLAEALVAYERAAATTERLLAAAPGEAQRIFDHAQSVFWVGYIARERGQRAQAEQAFVQYRELAQRLVAIDADKPQWQVEVAYAAQNLGIVMLDAARPADALRMLDESRAVTAPLVAKQPELAFDLAHTYGWMAKAHEQLGRYTDAVEMQRAKQALFLGLPDAARNQAAQRGLQNASTELTRLELARGRLSEALVHGAASVAQAKTLVERDPANLFWLSESCWARLRLADVQLALGQAAAARENLDGLRADVARLLRSDATQLEWSVGLRGQMLALSARLDAPSSAALLDELGAYAVTVQRLRDSGTVLTPAQLRAATAAQFESGRLLAAAGRHDQAQVQWHAVIAHLLPSAQGTDFDLLTRLALAQWAVGDHDAARALSTRIQASSYRHPAFAELVNDMATGTGPTPTHNPRRKPS